MIGRDHSFLQNAKFWAELQNLPTSGEFLCFHRILRNSVLASDIRDKYGIFHFSSGHGNVCIPDFTMKYMTATQALTGGILKILSWAYLKYCQLIWYCICQLQLPVTNTAYLDGFRGHRQLITICGKFAAVSRGIWQTGPWNLDKFAGVYCGP